MAYFQLDYRKYDGHAKNRNYSYILTLIDGFSRKAYTCALKTKRAAETAGALDEILSGMANPYTFFASDSGNEFLTRNPDLKNILEKKHHLQCYTLGGEIKGGMIERFNRTLKERIARYMTQHKTSIWVDVLDELTNLYNNTRHSATGLPPNDVGFDNAEKIRLRLYGNKGVKECTLKINDIVRIPTNKTIFSKGYAANWSKELYTISLVEKSFNRCWFKGRLSEI